MQQCKTVLFCLSILVFFSNGHLGMKTGLIQESDVLFFQKGTPLASGNVFVALKTIYQEGGISGYVPLLDVTIFNHLKALEHKEQQCSRLRAGGSSISRK